MQKEGGTGREAEGGGGKEIEGGREGGKELIHG